MDTVDKIQKLKDFLTSIEGRSYLRTPEIRELYRLYNDAYNTTENPNFCSDCLVAFIRKIKNNL